MDKIAFFALLLAVFFQQTFAKDSGCPPNYKCVSQCKELKGSSVFYPCGKGNVQMLCCPSEEDKAIDQKSQQQTNSKFPENCGKFSFDDRIINGDVAEIGQFPFMALLGYTQSGVPFVSYLCGGSLITDRYVLTASHCFLQEHIKMTTVRLGEHNLLTDVDCTDAGFGEKHCNEKPLDVDVEKIIMHPNFEKAILKNDIALVKVKTKIEFTEFIQPICLPFGKNIHKVNLENKTFEVAGWGKFKQPSNDGSTVLLYTKLTVWSIDRCNNAVDPNSKPIPKSQFCATGVKKTDACKGDSGGPVFNRTIENRTGRTYQIGIVSFGAAKVCGDPNVPTIFTRVDNFLDWIKDNVQ